MRPEDVISELRHSYDALTLSQKRIAEVIVEDAEFVAFATVDKFAGRLGVSPSTIVRFAYRMGFSGYPELQERVRELLRAQLRGLDGDERRPGYAQHLEGIPLSSLVHDIENLERTVRGLATEDLAAAIDALASARRVFVAGGATSQALAHYVGIALGRVRADVVVLTSEEQSLAALLDMTAEDALLVFTFPPYAVRTLRIVELAEQRGATAIAVADSPISPAGQRADIVVPAVVSGIGTQNSLVAPLAVANALLNGVAGHAEPERYEESVRLSRRWNVFLLTGDESA